MTDPGSGSGAGSGSGIEVRRAADRFVTSTDWLESRHSFSFGQHYDPANTGHGVLLVHNDDVLAPGGGFDTHPHRDMEIVTWVLEGSLAHEDSTGRSGVVSPGLAQRMSAGDGIQHSERNNAGDAPVHYVQMWVAPDEPGGDPGYEQREIDGGLLAAGLVPVVSGLDRHARSAAVRIRNRSAALHVSRPSTGVSVPLPDAPFLHLFVARGSVELEGPEGLGRLGRLDAGDAARFTAGGGHRVTARTPAEILVWEMHTAVA